MSGLRLLPGGVTAELDGFEVAFVDERGGQQREPLAEAWSVPFERVRPVRSIPSYNGQRNNPGYYWSATTNRHVEFESWLERNEALSLDFDPDVVGYAAQPLWLFWMEGIKRRSHAPDFFARRADGSGVVIDCRPVDRIKPRDQAAFDATARACAQMEWDYRLVHGHDSVWLSNVVWLAGYRAPRYRVEPIALALVEAFTYPRALIDGAQAVGDPVAVLPVLYHLLWCHDLLVDMAVRLEGWTTVTGADACPR